MWPCQMSGLDTLAAMYHPRKVTPATIEFVDPLVTGQARGAFVESLVALMRDADALAHVVRAFQHPACLIPKAAWMPPGIFTRSTMNSSWLI